MQNIVTKNTGDSLTAAEWNQIPDELENSITDTGQSLSGGDLFQVSKAMAIYAAGGAFYTDSGAADAYVLSSVGSKRAPVAYFEGMEIVFKAGNTNTGASTVNVAGLGVKTIESDGSPLVAGQISTEINRCTYNTSTGKFDLTFSGTANDILTRLKTVDGTGSGLDSDLLDGEEGTFYLARANHTGTQAIATLSDHNKAAHDALNIDADTLDSNDSAFFRDADNLNAGTLPAARFDDTAHGSRSGGTLHAEVIAAGAAGFMSGTDKTKLDGIVAGGGLVVQASQNVNGTVALPTDDTYATIATSSSFSVEVGDLILIDAESNMEGDINNATVEYFLKADKSAGTATIKPFVSRSATPLLDQGFYSFGSTQALPNLINRIFSIYTVTGAGTVTIQFQAKWDSISGSFTGVSIDAFDAGIIVLR